MNSNHNSMVAHSSRWDENPDVNETEFARRDFYIPESVKIHCFRGHDVTNENCCICDRSVFTIAIENSDLSVELGCYTEKIKKVDLNGIPYYDDVLKGHICKECYEDLPDGDGQ